MHQTQKGNQYYFCAKAHIGVDDESGPGAPRKVTPICSAFFDTLAEGG